MGIPVKGLGRETDQNKLQSWFRHTIEHLGRNWNAHQRRESTAGQEDH